MPSYLNKAEIRELIESDPDGAIDILRQHPAMANRLHVNRKTWEYCWFLANNIAPEQLKERKEQATTVSQETLTRIKEIEALPAYLNKLSKNHRALVEERFGLYQRLHQPA